MTLEAMARALNGKGLKTAKGRRFSRQTVADWLKNPAYGRPRRATGKSVRSPLQETRALGIGEVEAPWGIGVGRYGVCRRLVRSPGRGRNRGPELEGKAMDA